MSSSTNPYRPPSAPLVAESPLTAAPGFTPPRGGVVLSLGFGVITSLATVLVLWLQDGILAAAEMGDFDQAAAEASDLRVTIVSLADATIAIATIVLWGMWMVRAAKNARALSPEARFTFTPGWAFGSFFVPFVNLVRPFQAMKEIDERSRPQNAETGGGLLGVWWGAWLIGNMVSNAAMRLTLTDQPGIAELRSSSRVEIASSLLMAVAGVLALLVIRRINDNQLARVRELPRQA